MTRLDRNVRLYPVYQVLFNCFFWLPVFFLYFSEHLTLGRVLQLEALYYLTVVVLEVPSGYFSDAFGRRRTLGIAAGALVASYTLFFLGSTLAMFAGGQVCLAIAMSFNSGTDTALHFDSLHALGRDGEYAIREARAHRLALLATAGAALLGGLVALVQLRLAYAASLCTALALLGVVAAMSEPPRHRSSEPGRSFARQVGAALGQLRNRSLAWLMGFAVLMTVINHVPYELYQPYLYLLITERGLDLPGEGTPLATGLATAAMMGIAAWAAGRSVWLRDRIGLAPALLAATVLQILVMAGMGLLLHELVLVLIVLRSVPGAIMQPPIRAAITPQLPQSLRATYLSLQSLAGRLAFAGTLLALSLGSGDTSDWPTIARMSRDCALVGLGGFLVLVITARRCLHRHSVPL